VCVCVKNAMGQGHMAARGPHESQQCKSNVPGPVCEPGRVTYLHARTRVCGVSAWAFSAMRL
jgi:hypothetical protein